VTIAAGGLLDHWRTQRQEEISEGEKERKLGKNENEMSRRTERQRF
jgi:hypothetical protein